MQTLYQIFKLLHLFIYKKLFFEANPLQPIQVIQLKEKSYQIPPFVKKNSPAQVTVLGELKGTLTQIFCGFCMKTRYPATILFRYEKSRNK
jgi:hypothetical protein